MKGDIVKIKNSEELQKKLRSETNSSVKVRLIFLNALSNLGISYDEASEICGLSTSTGYVWIRKWNKCGYEALIDPIFPPTHNEVGGFSPRSSCISH